MYLWEILDSKIKYGYNSSLNKSKLGYSLLIITEPLKFYSIHQQRRRIKQVVTINRTIIERHIRNRI
jgi:hypothetical protein